MNFFEGALLGNGALGAVVCTRPDGILIHLGHNNVWDIRISERNKENYGTFKEVYSKIDEVFKNNRELDDDEWYREYQNYCSENNELVYNFPVLTSTIFPGEEHGIHSSEDEYQLALNTYKNQLNEGGNELVLLNMQGARLGALDLDKFKRQIEYCILPNGTCADMILQVHGRYSEINTI